MALVQEDENADSALAIAYPPTSDSLHIGSLVPIILLAHFQKSGHQPIALVGGATGMIGDPSGKSIERNLLDEETLRNNENSIKKQLSRFLSFDEKFPNHAMIKNNYDWMKEFSFLDFIRDIGKHITCLLYTSPSPRDRSLSRMPSSA